MLITAPGRFDRCTDNFTGTPDATLPGTNFTAGGNDVDGTAVSVLSALDHDVHCLRVAIGGINVSTGNAQAALDVLADPAGGTSWSALINDLVCGFTVVPSATAGLDVVYTFPFWIPAGTSLGVRCKTAHTSDVTSGRVVMQAYHLAHQDRSFWVGSGVETVGISDSRGTAITPGSTGTFGSWTSVGSTTARRFGSIQFGINGSDNNALARGYFVQLGRGSAQLGGSPTFYIAVAAAEAAARTGMGMTIPTDIPSGTQLQARATSSGTAEDLFVAAYGVF